MKTPYYDGSRALSYKRLLTFIIGSRGVGKTYFYKRLLINKALEAKALKFVWVRRLADDVKALKHNFFRDIEHLWPQYEFDATTELLRARTKEPLGDWFIIGYFIPLSLYERYKGNSFHGVEYVVYDEFITQGRYLTEEVFKFYDLLETIFRDRKQMRAILLANALSQLNPYFEVFNIKIDKETRYKSSDRWVLENVDAEQWIQYKQETPMGQLLQGTEYAQYSMGNQFILDDTSDIIEKPKGATTHTSNLILHGTKIGLWLINGGVYFGEQHESSRNFSIYLDDARNNEAILVSKTSKIVKFIAKMYKNNLVLGFQSLAIKQEVLQVALMGIKNYK
jgi:hypothetical protein